jgi:hypothetical protein
MIDRAITSPTPIAAGRRGGARKRARQSFSHAQGIIPKYNLPYVIKKRTRKITLGLYPAAKR